MKLERIKNAVPMLFEEIDLPYLKNRKNFRLFMEKYLKGKLPIIGEKGLKKFNAENRIALGENNRLGNHFEVFPNVYIHKFFCYRLTDSLGQILYYTRDIEREEKDYQISHPEYKTCSLGLINPRDIVGSRYSETLRSFVLIPNKKYTKQENGVKRKAYAVIVIRHGDGDADFDCFAPSSASIEEMLRLDPVFNIAMKRARYLGVHFNL